jgi:hypothetical protein
MVMHEALLRGAALAGETNAPVLLRRTDRNFLQAVLAGLRTPQGRDELAGTIAATRDPDGALRLHQPVHQVFTVALLQAHCETFAFPRLDAARVESCGLVVRRIPRTAGAPMERWSKAGDRVVGWVACADDDVDPDPMRRRPRLTAGHAEIDRRLVIPELAYAGVTEIAAPLFVAPPEVCVSARTTYLYGVVPLASAEVPDLGATPLPVFDPATVQKHLPWFLLPGNGQALPRAGAYITREDAGSDAFAALSTALRQLAVELDAFGDGREARALVAELDRLQMLDGDGQPAAAMGAFLRGAAALLIHGGDGSLQLPARWPDVDAATSASIARAVQAALEARLAGLLSPEARYEDASRRYRLRAFARVRRPDGCPPRTVWSEYSEPFAIAAWWESSGVPPVRIQLPPVDGDFLKSLKPNVAFTMPEELFNALQRDPRKMLRGEPTSPGQSSLGISWFCSFNIPVITLCAFFVLNIFLSLFDLFFRWMPFVKICIPIPRRRDG